MKSSEATRQETADKENSGLVSYQSVSLGRELSDHIPVQICYTHIYISHLHLGHSADAFIQSDLQKKTPTHTHTPHTHTHKIVVF